MNRRRLLVCATFLPLSLLGCGGLGGHGTVDKATVPQQGLPPRVVDAKPENRSGRGTVGTELRVVGQTGTGDVTVTTYGWHKSGRGHYASDPENGAYLVLDVTVVGTAGKLSYNPFYFKAKAADGSEYDTSVGSDGYFPALQSGDLAAGERARGLVTFDVPKGKTELEILDELLDKVASVSIPAD
jgi:hypothetical protein